MESQLRTIKLFTVFILQILFARYTPLFSNENLSSYPSNELLNDIKSFCFIPKQKNEYAFSETELILERKEVEEKLCTLFYKNKKTLSKS